MVLRAAVLTFTHTHWHWPPPLVVAFGVCIGAGVSCKSDPRWPHLKRVLSVARLWGEFQEKRRPFPAAQRQ
jgi:hypothetical protein